MTHRYVAGDLLIGLFPEGWTPDEPGWTLAPGNPRVWYRRAYESGIARREVGAVISPPVTADRIESES